MTHSGHETINPIETKNLSTQTSINIVQYSTSYIVTHIAFDTCE